MKENEVEWIWIDDDEMLKSESVNRTRACWLNVWFECNVNYVRNELLNECKIFEMEKDMRMEREQNENENSSWISLIVGAQCS